MLNEEKRLKDLYGDRNQETYKIKLNDQIIDTTNSNERQQPPGRLVVGSTILTNKVRKRSLKNDIWGTANQSMLGPGQYNTDVRAVKHKAPTAQFNAKRPVEMTIDAKEREEIKMIRIFDGSSSSIKNTSPRLTLKPLEERTEIKEFGQDTLGGRAIF
jgi:hypothetical protein